MINKKFCGRAGLCVLALLIPAAIGFRVNRHTRRSFRDTQTVLEQSAQTDLLLQQALQQTSTVSNPTQNIATPAADETKREPETLSEALPETPADTYRPEDYPVSGEHRVIFVGDSRTVGAGQAEAKTGDPCIFIGQSNEGYDWLSQTGVLLMEDAIANAPEVPVVFNLGVNDCDSIDRYLALYEELIAAHPDTEFYFMSVNPVTEESVHVPDSDVQAFNEKLQEHFPERYIDTYTWMTSYGFVSVDGVHYSGEQYCAIHDYAVRAILGLAQPQVGLTAEDETETEVVSEN